ncbi:MAG TPA: AAA family ATPase [Woeseiaceae bacterium]|nr:AAA family ATPase [Woeseiaceae bacterium]
MYTSFFGLNEKPFSITPDPRYLFMSERHGEALAHLVYGVTEAGGFIQLTGEVGTGKTTLVRTLLQNRLPANADVAVVLNPQLSALEFLQTIGEELGVPVPEEKQSIKAMIDALNHYLLLAHAEGRRTILVVDEAQNLARDVLEQVRLLTNLETSKQKLLQIILIGQPELRELLARNDLRQLAQRITGRYHLEPLSRDETAAYIEHRVRVAGAVTELFDAGAKKEMFKLSDGVPRLINVICDRALLGAYGREARRVNRATVRRAAREISGHADVRPWLRWLAPTAITAGVLVLGVGAFAVLQDPLHNFRGAARPQAPVTIPVDNENAGPGPATSATTAPQAGTTATASIVATPPEATLDEELILASNMTDSESALADLLGFWGVPDPASFRNCVDVVALGFECMAQRGSWNSLRQYNRPAILTLTDSQGDTHDAVLKAIDGDQAELTIAGVPVTHSIAEVSDLWFGQFLIVWKPANGVSDALGPGVQNANVRWLRDSLAEIEPRYRAEPLTSDFYDAGLESKVRDFQRDHRLTVDGLAGRQTQIIVNGLTAGSEVPRLITNRYAAD